MGRNNPLFEIRNVCAPCAYELEGEAKMEFSMMVAFDGNNSLKRRGRKIYLKDGSGKKVLGEDIERETGKVLECPLYVSEEEVDKYRNEVRGRKPVNTV
jgi:hypothetical protein